MLLEYQQATRFAPIEWHFSDFERSTKHDHLACALATDPLAQGLPAASGILDA